MCSSLHVKLITCASTATGLRALKLWDRSCASPAGASPERVLPSSYLQCFFGSITTQWVIWLGELWAAVCNSTASFQGLFAPPVSFINSVISVCPIVSSTSSLPYFSHGTMHPGGWAQGWCPGGYLLVSGAGCNTIWWVCLGLATGTVWGHCLEVTVSTLQSFPRILFFTRSPEGVALWVEAIVYDALHIYQIIN